VMTASPPATIVHEFAKNRREIVRTSLYQFEGRDVVDVRVWLPRSRDGQLVPGPKGLTIDRRLLPDLERATQAARAFIRDGRTPETQGSNNGTPAEGALQ